MKTFIVFALCVAAAAANLINPVAVADEIAEIQQIVEAINHPSTDPATAAALEQMLHDLLGLKPEGEPISVGPAIVDTEYEPISVGPAIIDTEYEPISVGPAIIDAAPVDTESVSSPLVQIIINVISGSQPAGEYEPISVGPAIVDTEYQPISVGPAIVDTEYEPISVGPAVVPEPVIVVETPEITEPINVAPVIIPGPVVVLPEILN